MEPERADATSIGNDTYRVRTTRAVSPMPKRMITTGKRMAAGTPRKKSSKGPNNVRNNFDDASVIPNGTPIAADNSVPGRKRRKVIAAFVRKFWFSDSLAAAMRVSLISGSSIECRSKTVESSIQTSSHAASEIR